MRSIRKLGCRTPLISHRALSTPSSSSFSAWGEVLNGAVPANAETAANKERMDALVRELNTIVGKVHLGGGEKAKAKQKARNKLVARERVNALVDPGTPFLELGTLAGYDMYNDWIPSGGIVTGIGRVQGLGIFFCLLFAIFLILVYVCF